MNIKVNTNIDSNLQEVSITIHAPKLTNEIQNIIQYLSTIQDTPNQIIGSKNNEIYFIDLKDIVCFFSKDKSNYLRTKEGIYKIKHPLYTLEDTFKTKGFIRISHSCIINIQQVDCFDISVLGTILVKLKDQSQEVVSKRNVSHIMKLLKERGNLK